VKRASKQERLTVARFVDTGTRIVTVEQYKREQQDNQDRARRDEMERRNQEWLESRKAKVNDGKGD
jgi:hypothetical protein